MVQLLGVGQGLKKFSTLFYDRLSGLSPQFDLTKVTNQEGGEFYRYDDLGTAEFKKFLNYQLPYGLRDRILGELFEEVIGDEREFSKSLYLSWDNIEEMKKGGMVFGAHCHTHRVLSRLSSKEKRFELEYCKSILVEKLGESSLPFSYPYGGDGSFDEETIRLLIDLGYSCAFTAIRGINKGVNLQQRTERFKLMRLDTNDLKV